VWRARPPRPPPPARKAWLQWDTMARPALADMLLASLLVTGATVAAAADAPCDTDEDCSLNGVCTSGKCDCDPGWVSAFGTGKGTIAPGRKRAGGCGLLDLKPAPSSVSFHGLDVNKSSWGGSILQLPSPTGKMQYAMFAAEMWV
jgi:hypothetical protein